MSRHNQYTILNALGDGALIIDQEYTIVFANQQMLDMYGIGQEEIIGKKCYETLHHCLVPCTEKCAPDTQCGHKQVFETGLPITINHSHLLPDGSTKEFQISISPLLNDKGTVRRVLHISKDITEQEQLKRQLHTTQVDQEIIFNNSPYTVSYLDIEMRILKINACMEELIGRKNAEVQGKHCYEIWGQHAGDTNKKGQEKICDVCKVRDAMADGRSYTYERRVGERYIEVTASPVRDKNGIVIGALETGKDVTERKEAEEQLYAYERILSATQDLMSFVDKNYVYQAVNDAYCRIHNKERGEIVGKSAADLHGQEVFNKTIKRQLDRSFAGELIHYEAWFDYVGIGRRYMEVTYYPFFDKNQITTGAVVNCRDITERKKSEDALRQSEARYSYLYNNLNDAAFIIGEDGTFLETNEVAQKRLGYTGEEFLRMSPDQIDAPEFVSGHKKRLRTVEETGSLFFETVHITKDGRAIPTEISARRINLAGEPCVLALARDITERKRAEADLKKNALEWSTAMDASEDAIYLLDLNRNLLRANKAFYLMTGSTPESAIDKHIEKIIHPEGEEKPCPVCLAQEEKRDAIIVMEPDHPDNPTGRPIEITVKVVKGDQEKPISIFMRLHDLTSQRKIEEDLRQSKEEWENTFNAMSDIVTIQDKNMRIVQANKAAHRFFEVQPDELKGRYCYEVFRSAAEPCHGCPMLETIENSKNHSRTIQHENLNKIFQVSASPIMDQNNEVQFLVHVAKDITEQKQLEEKLFQSQKMEAIGTLAGGIAHDFNNILSAIIGYAEFIQQEVPTESRIGKNIAEVLSAGKRAADLVKQILTFSRKTDAEEQPLRPHLIVKEAMKLLCSTLPTTISIKEDIDPDCGTILAAPTNIHRIIVNLCTNALHAMADEKGTLSVGLHRREVSAAEIPPEGNISAGPFIVLSVSDTGCGMSQDTIDHIFEPYYTTREMGAGTGLGLSVVHGIVQDCKGFIAVESTVGEGSTFLVYFPAIEEPTVQPVVVDREDKKTATVDNKRILVVDDEPLLVKINETRLKSRGYQVTAVSDSREALEKFRNRPDRFDLLITDQTMPGLTGAELAKAVLEIRPSLPIIMCTGHSDIVPEDMALAVGIKKYILKPLYGDELLDAVQEVLDE